MQAEPPERLCRMPVPGNQAQPLGVELQSSEQGLGASGLDLRLSVHLLAMCVLRFRKSKPER